MIPLLHPTPDPCKLALADGTVVTGIASGTEARRAGSCASTPA
ncbi:hypothetical protein [Rhodothermus marinus]|nr:hypothetical protein [Rhodothermus marinus]